MDIITIFTRLIAIFRLTGISVTCIRSPPNSESLSTPVPFRFRFFCFFFASWTYLCTCSEIVVNPGQHFSTATSFKFKIFLEERNMSRAAADDGPPPLGDGKCIQKRHETTAPHPKEAFHVVETFLCWSFLFGRGGCPI